MPCDVLLVFFFLFNKNPVSGKGAASQAVAGVPWAARRQFAKRGEIRHQVTAASELLPEGRV